MRVTRVRDDGIVVCADADSVATIDRVNEVCGAVPLIIADPPYGRIVSEQWDRTRQSAREFATWMFGWTEGWRRLLRSGGAFYVWGCIGRPTFRPFFEYLTMTEQEGEFELANLLTWSKKRAYGVPHNYLFTREECAYWINGSARKPAIFNIPYLAQKRGYKGYNKRYPAKSDHLRRTNVWTDVTEILRGKQHPTQKQQRLHEIMIEVHTRPGDWVVDPFAGAGTTGHAARKLGRKFVLIDNDARCVEQMPRGLS
ncbi:site-specific DNA-methyltransferase [Pendulispora brunnea]|uniref:Methyltransferase n=1 Tax=Pendulispora brunnea TaxID=2905690 RepID=A0ABZ2KDV9_9BACT